MKVYSDISVAWMKHKWQSLVEEISKKAYIKRETVVKDFLRVISSPVAENSTGREIGSREYNTYHSLIFMALLDAIDGSHVFIGLIDVRQDLNRLIDYTEKYDKEKKNISEEKIPCSYCNGHGRIGFTDEDGCQTWDCQACGGSGWIPSDPAKCVGFALCLHCSSERRVDFSEHDNDMAFPDYCCIRGKRVKPQKNALNWCPNFLQKKG